MAAIGALVPLGGPTTPGLAVTCPRGEATILGTSGRDRIRGTPRADVIAALGGGDLVRGRGGDDRICGGGGPDVLLGDSGGDRIEGGGAGDVLDGGAGGDRLRAGGGSDFLEGGNGADVLVGGGGSIDLLRGRSGNDRLFGKGGFDILIGDRGDDLLHGGGGRVDLVTLVRARRGVTVDLTRGRATGEGNDRVRAVEDVEATRFDDVLIGNGRQNFFVPLGGDDVVDGRGERDQVLYLSSPAPVTLDLAAGTGVGEGADTLTSIEGAYGSVHDDVMSGDDLANFLFGFEGSDTISGSPGDDILDGDSGFDAGEGGEGNDVCANFENGTPPPECESTTIPSGVRRPSPWHEPGAPDAMRRMLRLLG